MSDVEGSKQEGLLELIKKKKECDKRAQEIVLKLIEPEIDKAFLINNAIHIGPPHFDDVIEERKLTGICGWALCVGKLDPKLQTMRQQYVIRGKRVLDITERKAYCSSQCYAKSTHFKKQLLTCPLWLREEEEMTATFKILDDDIQLHGLAVNITGLKLEDDNDDDKEKDKESTSSETEDNIVD